MTVKTSGNIILWEPAPSKRILTPYKNYFLWKFKGKKPDAADAPSIEHRASTLTVKKSMRPHYLGNVS
jgi:hypothetical protein